MHNADRASWAAFGDAIDRNILADRQPTFALSDVGNAQYLAYHFGDRLRHNHQRDLWLVWRDGRWKPDTDGAVMRLAIEAIRQRQRDAVDLDDPDARSRAVKWALASESKGRLDAALSLAADLPPIADDGSGWDAEPAVLQHPNGVSDLRTGELREAEREDRITLCTRVPYIPDARSDLWESTLREVFINDDAIDYFHVAVGYSATGEMREDRWMVCPGSGRNGKGTTLGPIAHALGDYAMELPAAVFDRSQDNKPYDLAYLPGRRFVLSSESGDTIRLNHDRIKQITGGDRIRAAAKYEKSFEFNPVCKLWLACNHKPRVTDDTPAFWARVVLIPFTVSFLGRENRNLRPALTNDPEHQAAILAWIVRGAQRYYASGFPAMPAQAQDAAAEYRQDSDPLADFIAEAIDIDPESEVSAGELFAHYGQWADRQKLEKGERLRKTSFGLRATARFASRRDRYGKHYMGIACRIW